MLHRDSLRRIFSIVLFVGPAVTLLVSPAFSYDPINPVKLLVLATGGFAILGILLAESRKLVSQIQKSILLLSAIFLCGLLIPIIFLRTSLTQQIWGTFGRNTGLVTYVALASIFLGTCALQKSEWQERILNSLIWTNVPMVIYCFLQILKVDPVQWSQYAPFGTLGNVNFLSSFLGIVSVTLFVKVFDSKVERKKKGLYALLMLSNIFVIIETQSIQGLLVFSAGVLLSAYFLIRNIARKRNISIWIIRFYWIPALSGVTLGFLGLADKGPLAPLLFQQTVLFRFDYMRAALKMMTSHPFTGVGLDGYGDYYRSNRDIIAAFRTSLNRTSNSAHNIFLDIGSGAGFIPFFAYVALVLLVLTMAIRKLIVSPKLDFTLLAITASWLGYVSQAMGSINQIGVGIWGWILAGLAYSRVRTLENIQSDNLDDSSKDKKLKTKGARSKTSTSSLPPLAAALAFIGLVSGFVLAYIPFSADMSFQGGNKVRDLTALMKSAKMSGATAMHMGMTIDIAQKNNYPIQASEIDRLLVKKYPGELYGWQVLATLNNPSSQTVERATSKIRELDPFVAMCKAPNGASSIVNLMSELSPSRQRALIRYWELGDSSIKNQESPFASSREALMAYVQLVCNQV